MSVFAISSPRQGSVVPLMKQENDTRSEKRKEEKAPDYNWQVDSQIISVDGSEHKLLSIFTMNNKNDLEPRKIGGKAANLYKLASIEGITIPQWFVVTAEVFEQFLINNHIVEIIKQLDVSCSNLNNNSEEIDRLTKLIQLAITQGTIASSLRVKISEAYENIQNSIENQNESYAVRSSGVMEDDALSSCAGLYDTFLNCKSVNEIIQRLKAVWASSFNPRVVHERIRLGIKQQDCLMGVIVQKQIDARASGVAATLVLSNNYPGIQIAANYGVGESVVSGEVSVDGWIVHTSKGYILEEIKGSKETCHILDTKNGTIKVQVATNQRNRFALNQAEVHQLADQVAYIKTHYGCHVDVEFAVDQAGKIFILQARPLVSINLEKILVVDAEDAKNHSVLAQGLYSVSGVATGRLVFINSWEDLATGKIRLTKEDIALAYITTNTWSQYLTHIKGLITREGSPSSHPILLCRERKIPCIIGIHHNFEELIKYQGQLVTLDGVNKKIYKDKVETREANAADLMLRFETIKIREWPNLSKDLPHLLHNNMAVQQDGKYWRRTPTYHLRGFQLELNMRRFAVVPRLLNKEGEVTITSRIIDGYSCNELVPFENYVALFKGFSLETARSFNKAQEECMSEFITLSENFILDADHWHKYIETYAHFRAFIWLGAAFRAFTERRVDEIGLKLELPSFYLDECAYTIQAKIPEIDTVMSQDIHDFAKRVMNKALPQKIEELIIQQPTIYDELVSLSKKYRFEHTISLDTPTDLDLVYKRIKQEIEALQTGSRFSSSKHIDHDRLLLPEHPELREWLRLSIWNRILQSDAHHLDSRAKTFVRSKLLSLGELLVAQNKLVKAEKIFDCTIDEIASYLKNLKGK